MESNVAIDYLSFTVDLVNKIDDANTALEVIASQFISDFGYEFYEAILMRSSGWEIAAGYRPYKFGYQNKEVGIFCHFGGHDNALIQFSGNGCKFLAMAGLLNKVISVAHSRVTRLDIAIDIPTETMPVDFIKEGYNGRIKSDAIINSAQGQTVYLGSRKSEKYCRVYRYFEPHPRAKKLRVEYETKKKYARAVALSIHESGLETTAQSISDYYEWGHEDMPKLSELSEQIQTETSQRSDSKTLLWLMKQCAPAFQRLVTNGTISEPEQFFKDHFLPISRLNEKDNE
jgi:hypothetical protein